MDSIDEDSVYYQLFFPLKGEVEEAWGRGGIYTDGDDFPDGTGDYPFKIERENDQINIFYTDPNTGEWILFRSRTFDFTDPIYIGIGAVSWAQKTIATGYFQDVELKRLSNTSLTENWELYQ